MRVYTYEPRGDGQMTELTFKRIRSGLYRSESTTVLVGPNGEEESQEVVIHVGKQNWNGSDTWSVQIWRSGNECGTHGLVTGSDCPCRTYKEAKAQAAVMVAAGFKYHSQVGYCLRG
ncbi:MAG TPA: hypothetical protein V6D20_23885 [Candidatus Obscuribacterales bacterium]